MTLRNVIVLAPSGLVLFAKEYGHAVAQPRLLGSLLTAMTEFATQTTAMRPSYIEMSRMAVTLVWDDVARVACALVHDRTDTALFGRLLASEILLAFVEEYGARSARDARPGDAEETSRGAAAAASWRCGESRPRRGRGLEIQRVAAPPRPRAGDSESRGPAAAAS